MLRKFEPARSAFSPSRKGPKTHTETPQLICLVFVSEFIPRTFIEEQVQRGMKWLLFISAAGDYCSENMNLETSLIIKRALCFETAPNIFRKPYKPYKQSNKLLAEAGIIELCTQNENGL